MEYLPSIIRGTLIAVFLLCVMEFDIKDIKVWGAIITLNILFAM
jgi:hypothetical protein